MEGFPSFSGHFFTVLVYYLEVGDIGSGVLAENAVFVNFTSDINIVLFYSFFQTSAGFSYIREVAISFWPGPFANYVLF